MNINALLQPFTMGNLHLTNRIVMAPMTRGFSPDGVPGANVAAYYKRRAENGVGLIITEGTGINHPAALDGKDVPFFHGEKSLQGWTQVVEAVHASGGSIVPQLWHTGMSRPVGKADLPNPETLSIGPSGIDLHGDKLTQPMTEADIHDVIQAFAQAAADAKTVGFDGIEIHGAHGYLIDQFFWAKTNRREDRYGGDLVARTRFAEEVIRACRQAVGPDFPIIFRYSQWKVHDFEAELVETAEELARFLAPLTAAGVDIFHCSTRRFWKPAFAGSPLNLAGWTKKLTGKPTITVGSVGLNEDFLAEGFNQTCNVDYLNDMIDRGEADLVAIGRSLLADPKWFSKIKANQAGEITNFNNELIKILN